MWQLYPPSGGFKGTSPSSVQTEGRNMNEVIVIYCGGDQCLGR